MGETKADNVPDPTGESTLRGAALDGSEQEKSVAHTAFQKNRSTDTTLRLDGEEDTLYDDGLDVDESAPALIVWGGEDSTR